jgi:hypothetical protein
MPTKNAGPLTAGLTPHSQKITAIKPLPMPHTIATRRIVGHDNFLVVVFVTG